MRGIACFDLDNTLLAGDSDFLWNAFLAEHALVKNDTFAQQNQGFYRSYAQGCLDVRAYQRFQLGEMAKLDLEDLKQWRKRYIIEKIQPIVLPKAIALVEHHRQQQHQLILITATNRFVTEPIAALLNIAELIATEPQYTNGQLTGDIDDTPCYQEGKVERLQTWLQAHQLDWSQSWFYSDSHNDLPLLQKVTHPIAVNPDATLAAHAKRNHWALLDLRS